jgi:hypothetical protein
MKWICQIKGIELLWHRKGPEKLIRASPLFCYALIIDKIIVSATY